MPCKSKGSRYGKTNPHPKDPACAGQRHHDLPETPGGSYKSGSASYPKADGAGQRGTGPKNERGHCC